jgi:hypothetical protein
MKNKKEIGMRRRIFAAALLLLLLHAPALAAGQLIMTGKFTGGGKEFDFAQYTETGTKEKVAIIGIEIDNKRTSVAFSPNEWHSFAELWHKAQGVHSATWQPVGNFQETGTAEQALLAVAAGPGVQFTITGQKGPFVFVLQPGDYARFDGAVNQMTAWAAQ